MKAYKIIYNVLYDEVRIELLPDSRILNPDAKLFFFTEKIHRTEDLSQNFVTLVVQGPWEVVIDVWAEDEEAALEIAESVFSVWLGKLLVSRMREELEVKRRAFRDIRENEAEQTKGGNKDD